MLDPPKCRLVDMHLAGRGDRQAKRVMFGRSIGATCAVHLAKSHTVHGLIVDSGLMSIKQLPTVQMPPGHTGENQRLVVNPQQILNIQNNFLRISTNDKNPIVGDWETRKNRQHLSGR